ncbi:MAG: chromate efflux transporter [Acidobacteria bacterium]|nr:chromate efflux transporter [Acidobacteriota bacterium]
MQDHSEAERQEPYAYRLAELARLYLKLGTIGFGGPAATIAMMEDEVVHRRHWLTHEEFLDLLGATNLIPGPNSTEMAIHIGRRRAGWLGLIVAGSFFILPATIIVGILSWAYVGYGRLPQAEGLLYGVKPVVLAIVLQAVWRLGRTALKTKLLVITGIIAGMLSFLGVNELLILLCAGVVLAAYSAMVKRTRKAANSLRSFWPGIPVAAAAGAAGTAAAAPLGLWPLFLFFLKIGSVLFGSGYVLLVFLRADLVDRWHWLTESQLLDGIAVGQITAGPVFTTATFIGYLLSGIPGAILATIGIFLPAFLFVAVSGPLIPWLRRTRAAGAFLDGVNAASLALMAVVMIQLGRSALVDIPTLVICAAAAFLLLRYRLNSTWLVLGGTTIGILVYMIDPNKWLRFW